MGVPPTDVDPAIQAELLKLERTRHQAAKLALARAGLDPDAAIAASDDADAAVEELNATAGVVELVRVPSITMEIEVDEPTKFNRWRWFWCHKLIRLAAWLYPFKVEFYRTKRPYE